MQYWIDLTRRTEKAWHFVLVLHLSSYHLLPRADIGDYAELTIQFSGIPKSQYNDSSWQSRLLKGVQCAIAQKHTNLPLYLIELVGVRVAIQNSSQIIDDSKDILKRQAGAETVVYVYVDVNILPAEYTSQSIGESFQVATHVRMHDVFNMHLCVFLA